MSTVLVTGGSGFIGAYVVLSLLKAGHDVRTTVRSLDRESAVRATLLHGGVDAGERLKFFAVDLLSDRGWREAVEGCEFVHHVASPLPIGVPKNDDDVIVPAREGALRAMRFSRDAGVRRVILTSSFAAVGYGHAPQTGAFTEEDWTNLHGRQLNAYTRSKAIAEKVAWEFLAREGGNLQLATVNPVAVLGPVLDDKLSASIAIVSKLLDGSIPGCPNIAFGIVDVRDVADLHLRAMTHADANGQRFLAISGEPYSLVDVAKLLKRELGPRASKVKTRTLPDFAVKFAALFDKNLNQIVPELGWVKRASAAKAQTVLGWNPRTAEEAILATAESLFQLNLVKSL